MLIETAVGMVNVDEVAAACPERMEAMVFGVADYAASLQSHTASIGGVDEHYSVLTDPNGTRARAPLGRPVALPARAHRRRLPRVRAAPDRRPVRRLHRPRGLPRRRAPRAVLGYEGKWAIHPSQIELANEVFTPDAAAGREDAPDHRGDGARPRAEGKGAVSLDGRLIDAASIRMAENLLAKLEQIEAARPAGGGARAGAAGRSPRLVESARSARRLPGAPPELRAGAL